MRKDASAEMAAVDVMRSRRTSMTQDRYSWSLTQRSDCVHTQVPPVSLIIEAFTEICVQLHGKGGGSRGK